MDIRKKEHELQVKAKAEFDYIASPDNCGVIVRSHVNGIVIAGYIIIFIFLMVSLIAVYTYSKHQRQHRYSSPAESVAPSTQPQ